jgi:hypothetical protein
MLGDASRFKRWATWKLLENGSGKVVYETPINFGLSNCPTLCLPLPLIGIGYALRFRLLDCLHFYKDPLAFVSLSCAAPSQNNGLEIGMFRSPTRQSSIATR